MSDEDFAVETPIEYAPVVRRSSTPAPATGHALTRRPSRELGLTAVALASGLTLAFEAVRLAARAGRRRSAARRATQPDETPAAVVMTYEWTRVVYERRERP